MYDVDFISTVYQLYTYIPVHDQKHLPTGNINFMQYNYAIRHAHHVTRVYGGESVTIL